MKKQIRMIAILAGVLFLLCGCGGAAQGNSGSEKAELPTTDTVPVILNQAEYTLYQNVFYNGYGDSSTGSVTKRGIYTTVQDAFNGVTRHYVWGYLDNTLCCDWQWEIVPKEGTVLPAEGSLIQVSGNFAKDEEALDKYRILDAQVTTETVYTGEKAELGMLTMSDTLERVQMQNIMYKKASFEGKEFTAYGRIAGINTLEDPYYSNSWQIAFQTENEVPAIGTMVRLRGIVKDGSLTQCKIETKEQKN